MDLGGVAGFCSFAFVCLFICLFLPIGNFFICELKNSFWGQCLVFTASSLAQGLVDFLATSIQLFHVWGPLFVYSNNSHTCRSFSTRPLLSYTFSPFKNPMWHISNLKKMNINFVSKSWFPCDHRK